MREDLKQPVVNAQKPDVSINTLEVNRIIEMAWEDRTPFEAIKRLYGLNEGLVPVEPSQPAA